MLEENKNPLDLIKYKIKYENVNSAHVSNITTDGTVGLFLMDNKCSNVLSEVNNEQNYSLILSSTILKCAFFSIQNT
jgi:hypothetical protein